jgi:hypothetical protein
VHHPRIALIYDDTVRPDTTGGYCLRALQSLASATHLPPDRLADARGDFELWVRVDDGRDFRLPPGLAPSALWAIDTHLNLLPLLTQASAFPLPIWPFQGHLRLPLRNNHLIPR